MKNQSNLYTYIRENLDILRVVSNYLTVSKKGRSYIALCPFHEDTKASLSISPTRNCWKCFACNAKGDAFKFITMYEKLNFYEGVKICKERFNLDHKDMSKVINKTSSSNQKLYDCINAYIDIANQTLINKNEFISEEKRIKVLNYLSQRGVDIKYIEKHKIGFITEKGMKHIWEQTSLKEKFLSILELGLVNEKDKEIFKDRIIFPLKSIYNDKYVGVCGRTVNPNEKVKYLVSPYSSIFKKSESYFGSFNDSKDSVIHIAEGIFDQISLENQLNKSNSIALMGTSLSEESLYLLDKKNIDIAIIYPDTDAVGTSSVEINARALMKHNNSVYVARTDIDKTNIKDVSDFCNKFEILGDNFKSIEDVKNCLDSNTYTFNQWLLTLDYESISDLSNLVAKEKCVKRFLKNVNEWSNNPLHIESDLEYCSSLFKVGKSSLLANIKTDFDKGKMFEKMMNEINELQSENNNLKEMMNKSTNHFSQQ